MTQLTNTTITRLIKNIVAIVGNIAEDIININYKAIIEALIEIHLKVIARRNAIFIKSQIAS
jgi:hypothetical protein